MLTRRLWIFALIALALSSIANAELERLNSVAAIVGDTPITLNDVKTQTAPVEQVLYQQYGSDPAAFSQRILEVRQRALESLIERQLILTNFEKQGYVLPEKIIDERVQERIRSDFGDRLTLTKTLQAQGITYESFRKEIKEQVIVDFLSSKNISSISLVSPFEIEKYYNANQDKFQQDERIRLSMIYIATAEGDSDRFNKLVSEYKNAPIVTRERLYLEAMQEVFSNVSKVMVENKSGSNLLYLPLDKLVRERNPAGANNFGNNGSSGQSGGTQGQNSGANNQNIGSAVRNIVGNDGRGGGLNLRESLRDVSY